VAKELKLDKSLYLQKVYTQTVDISLHGNLQLTLNYAVSLAFVLCIKMACFMTRLETLWIADCVICMLYVVNVHALLLRRAVNLLRR